MSRVSMYDRPWLVLWVTCVGAFMSPLDFSAVSVALPDMGHSVHLSFSEALWVQAGYLLTYTLALVPAGRIADQWGRLQVWRVGVALFAATSLITGVSMNATWLVIARSLQGVGAGILTGTAVALVSTVFAPQQRGRAIGFNVTAVYLGLSTGPLIGGLLVSGLGWRWVFFINVPVAAAALLVSRRLVDPERRHGRPQLDWPGALVLALALGTLLVPLIFAAEWGWSSPQVIGLFCVSILSFVAFAFIERNVRAPVLDLGLFRRSRLFAAANAAALLNYTAMFGSLALTAIALQVVSGRSPIATGTILIFQPAIMMCISPFAGRLSDRIGSRLLCTTGMVSVAVGLGILSTMPTSLPISRIIPAMCFVGVGMAMFSSPNMSSAMNAAPSDALGVAGGVLTLMRSLGQSMSIAILGAITAAHLGAEGGRVILGGHASAISGVAYMDGYRIAMAVAAGIALAGAVVSLTRGGRAAGTGSVISVHPTPAPVAEGGLP